MRLPRFFALIAMCAAGLPGPLSAQQWGNGSGGAIYYNGGNVGIGTASPAVTLQIQGKTYSSSGFWVGGGDLVNTVNGSTWYGLGLTSTALYGPVQAVQLAGWGGLNFQTGSGQMVIRGDTGNVGIGVTNPAHLLQVAGTIGAEEVIVSSTGADYVFHRGYRLMPLAEVAHYIHENHHLPDIPSAEEAKQKGISVGEMQTKLLAKIEELTLHAIQEEERNDRLEQQNQELQRRIDRLEANGGNAVPK